MQLGPRSVQPASSPWPRTAAVLAYVATGLLTAEVANAAATSQGRTGWRLAAWLLSGLIFVVHVAVERVHAGHDVRRAARHAACAVAIAAFIIAAVGPVRSHWGAQNFWRVVALSLLLWPLLTGLPAWLAALVVGQIVGRVRR